MNTSAKVAIVSSLVAVAAITSLVTVLLVNTKEKGTSPKLVTHAHLAQTIEVVLRGEFGGPAYAMVGEHVDIVCHDAEGGYEYGAFNGKSLTPVNSDELDARITGDVPLPCDQWSELHPDYTVLTRDG